MNSRKSGRRQMAVIVPLRGDRQLAIQYLKQLGKLFGAISPDPQWIVLDLGVAGGELSKDRELRRLRATLIQGAANDEWKVFHQAAALVDRPWTLLLTLGSRLEFGRLKKQWDEREQAEMIWDRRGRKPFWAALVSSVLDAGAELDMGAHLLIQSQLLKRLALESAAEDPFLALRWVALSSRWGAKIRSLDFPSTPVLLGNFDALGEKAERFRYLGYKLIVGICVALMLIVSAVTWIAPQSPFLGLCFLIPGTLLLAGILGSDR